MFDEELMKHLIAYLEDYPEDIKLDDYREDTRVLISGRMGNADTWGSRNDFTVALNYDKAGNLKNINGIEFTFDTSPLRDAIKKAITRNFKLKRKMTKLGKGNNT